MKKVMIVDFSAISNATFHVARNDKEIETEEQLSKYWKLILLTSILNIKKIAKPHEVILAIDSRSWRKEYFEFYKIRRAMAKDKSNIDFEWFYAESDKIVSLIKENVPWKVIKEYGAEGDDILAIMTNELHKHSEITLVTSDKDLKQLLILPNVKYYSFRNKRYETAPNPKLLLQIQILTGDSGDDIPNVKSPDNCFAKGIRQTPCGEKTAEKILWEGLENFLKDPEMKRNYVRNWKLIELSKDTIPQYVWDGVVNQYYNHVDIPRNYMNLADFLYDNKLMILKERITEFLE